MLLDINALSPSEQQRMRTELNELIESMEELGRDFTVQLDRLPSSAECYKGNPEDLEVELKESISSSLTLRLSPSHQILAGYKNEIGVADGHEELGFDPDDPVDMTVLFLRTFLIPPLRNMLNLNREMETIQAENPSILAEVAEYSLESSKELSEMAAMFLERKSQVELADKLYQDVIPSLRRSVSSQQRKLLAPLLDLDKALVNCLNEQREGDDPEKPSSISQSQEIVVQDLADSANVVSEDSMPQESTRGEGTDSLFQKLDDLSETMVKSFAEFALKIQQNRAIPNESNIEHANDIKKLLVLFKEYFPTNPGLDSNPTSGVQCDDDLLAPDPNSRLSVTIDPPKVVFDGDTYNVDKDVAIFLYELWIAYPATVSFPSLQKREKRKEKEKKKNHSIELTSTNASKIKEKIRKQVSEKLFKVIKSTSGSGSVLDWIN